MQDEYLEEGKEEENEEDNGPIMSEREVVDSYDEMLDSEGEVTIGGLKYFPSLALKRVDPTAYRCGLLDYVNSLSEDDSRYNDYAFAGVE